MSMQQLIKRLCAKSKELAFEKRRNYNLANANEKLVSEMKNMKDETQNLNGKVQKLNEKIRTMKILQNKAIYEILFLKLQLHEEKNSQFDKYDTQYSESLNSQDSTRSSEEALNTDDENMIDSEYADSNCDEDRDYVPTTDDLTLESEASDITTDSDELMN